MHPSCSLRAAIVQPGRNPRSRRAQPGSDPRHAGRPVRRGRADLSRAAAGAPERGGAADESRHGARDGRARARGARAARARPRAEARPRAGAVCSSARAIWRSGSPRKPSRRWSESWRRGRPTPSSRRMLAEAYAQSGRHVDAVTAAAQGRPSSRPKLPRGWFALGHAYNAVTQDAHGHVRRSPRRLALAPAARSPMRCWPMAG